MALARMLLLLLFVSLTSCFSTSESETCELPLPMPPFRRRTDLAMILEQLGMTRGAEVGVQRGGFAKNNLKKWRKNKEYWVIDLWRFQKNYVDLANVNDVEQETNMQKTLELLRPFQDQLVVCRNYSTVCATRIPDGHLDFVYVDARHDRKGVYEDLVAYWPKIRKGGIMAGHDFLSQAELRTRQDWTKNYDGTIDETGQVVRGAVVDFFSNTSHPERLRTITVSYAETSHWVSWATRK